MTVKLLTEQYFEFLSLTGGCKGSSESTLVKIRHCWKSHATVQLSTLHLLMTIANSLDPDQAGQNLGPDVDPKYMYTEPHF